MALVSCYVWMTRDVYTTDYRLVLRHDELLSGHACKSDVEFDVGWPEISSFPLRFSLRQISPFHPFLIRPQYSVSLGNLDIHAMLSIKMYACTSIAHSEREEHEYSYAYAYAPAHEPVECMPQSMMRTLV